MEKKNIQNGQTKNDNYSTIRITTDARKLGEAILQKINKKERGRKVYWDDLLKVALTLIEANHIRILQNDSLSFEDQKELWREVYSKKVKKVSPDEFTGLLLSGEFLKFKEANGEMFSL